MIVIVIPCYEGAGTVADVVRGARASGLPVVVVDDGSTDDSSRVAEAAGATVLRHPQNRGKGAALASGFAYASKLGADAVLSMDADGQHDPAEIAKLAAAHERNPTALVVGVRSFAPEDMPRRSRIGNRISTWWISRYAGRTHKDTQSGFRVYPRALFDVPLRSTRFETESELLLRAAKLKLPLVEVPIRTIYSNDHASHFHGFRDTMRVIKLVFFSPLWLLLFFVGCAHAHALPSLLPASREWKTLRSQQKVTISVGDRTRTMRALVAVERPDKVRVVGMGPAGITVFDAFSVAGATHVVKSIKDPNDPGFERVITDTLGEISAAYDLEPRPADRKIEGDTITQDGITIHETAAAIDIDAKTALPHRVHVEVLSDEKDVALDPAMWSQ